MNTITESVGFKLRQIKTEQFAIIEKAFTHDGKIAMNTGFSFTTVKDQHIVGIIASFTFEQDDSPFLLLKISCHFEIADLAWNSFLKESGDIIIPKGFMAHLTMLTVGTARGTLHSKTEGTLFNQFLLPTINVTALITEDITFK